MICFYQVYLLLSSTSTCSYPYKIIASWNIYVLIMNKEVNWFTINVQLPNYPNDCLKLRYKFSACRQIRRLIDLTSYLWRFPFLICLQADCRQIRREEGQRYNVGSINYSPNILSQQKQIFIVKGFKKRNLALREATDQRIFQK